MYILVLKIYANVVGISTPVCILACVSKYIHVLILVFTSGTSEIRTKTYARYMLQTKLPNKYFGMCLHLNISLLNDHTLRHVLVNYVNLWYM